MEVPNRIGRYRIASVLGAGSFATVYLGRDEALDVPVAVKVLGQNWAFDPDVRRRFIQEAQLLRRVDGTRVVRVHDIGQDDEGRPFFVMDYAERGTVEDRLIALANAGQRLGVDDVVRLCRQLAAGVREVHQLGVVHRDLKPGNLLLRSSRPGSVELADAGLAIVGADEHLVVGDLGLARELLGASRLTPAVGTPGYMAPEQLDPAAGLDQRADLFGCTAILQRAVTGQHPPPVAEDPALLDWSGVPAPLRDLAMRGMALDPEERFTDVDHWLAAVEQALGTVSEIPAAVSPALAAGLSTLEPPSGRLALGAAGPVGASLGTLPPMAPKAAGGGRRWGLLAIPVALVAVVVAVIVALVVRGGDDTVGPDGGDDTAGAAGDDGDDAGTDGSGPVTVGTGLQTGPDVAADEAVLIDPIEIVADGRTLYVAESGANRIVRIDLDAGTVATIAGTGRSGFSGDGGPALDADLSTPLGMDLTDDGGLLVADSGNARVRRIDLTSGTIATVAGTGTTGASGDGGAATDANLYPTDVEFGPDGSFYIVDGIANLVRRVDPAGVISTFAGTGRVGSGGDGGPATAADFGELYSAVATNEAVFLSDAGNNTIRRVDLGTGVISTVAGTGAAGNGGDGGPAVEAELSAPDGLAIAEDGALLVADEFNRRVRRVDAGDATITTIAGSASPDDPIVPDESAAAGDLATDVALTRPAAVAPLGGGGFAVVDTFLNLVLVVDGDGVVDQVIGVGAPGAYGDNNLATDATLLDPYGLDFTPDGELLVLDGDTLRKVDADGVIRRIFLQQALDTDGDGTADIEADDVITTGRFGGAADITVAADGTAYIVESLSARVVAVGPTGLFAVVAGTGVPGFSGDGGPAIDAQFNNPSGLVVGASIAVADFGNSRVRSLGILPDDETQTLRAFTAVGGGGAQALRDAGPALEVLLFGPFDVAVNDGFSAIVVTGAVGARVVRVADDDGDGEFDMTTIAGTGEAGFSGDGGPATEARVDRPQGVAIDGDGVVYFADAANQRIRRIGTDGTISTIAGTGEAGFSGDGGPATEASLRDPSYLTIGPDGALYVVDAGNQRIRRIDITSGVITTIVGGG